MDFLWEHVNYVFFLVRHAHSTFFVKNLFLICLLLYIQEFEDLDEIIARHIQPMAAFVRDILNYKYYKDSDGGNREIMEKICLEEKKKAPSKLVMMLSFVCVLGICSI